MSGSGKLASLRDGWQEVQIRDVATLNPESLSKGAPPTEIRYLDIAAVSAEGIDRAAIRTLAYADAPSRAQRVVRVGDSIISTVRPYLRARAFIAAELDGYVASTGFCVLRPGEQVIAGYLDVVTSTDDFYRHLESRQTGTTYPAVRPADIGEIGIPLPPIEEQRRIADLLGSMDLLMDRVRARAGALTELRLRYLGSAFEDVREAHCTVGSRAEVQSGVSWGKADELDVGDPDGIGVMGVTNVQRDHVHATGCTWIPRTPQAEKRLIKPHTILTIRTNGNAERIGNVHLAPNEAVGFTISSFLTSITPHDPDEAGYLLRALQSPQVQRAITAATSGSTGLKNIAVTWLRQLEIPWPSPTRRREVATTASAFDVAAAAHAAEEHGLHSLRRALLATLLSGEREIEATYDRFLAEVA